MQKVELLVTTPNLLRVLYTACKTCYSENTPQEIFEKSNKLTPELEADNEIMQDLVFGKVFKSGHLSIAEHVNFTFAISGISRTCSHQLVRHRHASFSQKSQRYVAYHKPFDYITPESIKNTYFEPLFHQYMKDAQLFYSDMLAQNIPAEDARYIFPNACETSMTVTINLREFIHICNLRLCLHAQWEIRALVEKMKNLVIQDHPYLKEFLVPKCKTCTEHKKCSKK